MSIPFHKQTDPNKQAGQHQYGFDREPYLKHSNAAPYEPRVEQTLNEYIARKQEEPQRITFEEWWGTMKYPNPPTNYSWAQQIWNAALTKGKL